MTEYDKDQPLITSSPVSPACFTFHQQQGGCHPSHLAASVAIGKLAIIGDITVNQAAASGAAKFDAWGPRPCHRHHPTQRPIRPDRVISCAGLVRIDLKDRRRSAEHKRAPRIFVWTHADNTRICFFMPSGNTSQDCICYSPVFTHYHGFQYQNVSPLSSIPTAGWNSDCLWWRWGHDRLILRRIDVNIGAQILAVSSSNLTCVIRTCLL